MGHAREVWLRLDAALGDRPRLLGFQSKDGGAVAIAGDAVRAPDGAWLFGPMRLSSATTATCSVCPDLMHIRQGASPYCVKHYRINQMRSCSRTRGKKIPSRAEVEALIPTDLRCPHCREQMTWLASGGNPITLQHDRSGAFRVLCQACNSRHARLPGDTFYDLEPGTWPCPRCEQVLPLTAYGREKSGARKPYCPPCHRAYAREYKKLNAERLREGQRRLAPRYRERKNEQARERRSRPGARDRQRATERRCRANKIDTYRARSAKNGRTLRARRRAEGICLECPAPAVRDNQRCAVHIEKSRERKRQYRQRLRSKAQPGGALSCD